MVNGPLPERTDKSFFLIWNECVPGVEKITLRFGVNTSKYDAVITYDAVTALTEFNACKAYELVIAVFATILILLVSAKNDLIL